MADKSKYYQMVAEAIIAHADPIYDAIDRYLAKADEDLEDQLKEEGYAEPKDTVSEMNSLEEEIADILHSQTTALVTALKAADGDWDTAQENVSDMIDEDDIMSLRSKSGASGSRIPSSMSWLFAPPMVKKRQPSSSKIWPRIRCST